MGLGVPKRLCLDSWRVDLQIFLSHHDMHNKTKIKKANKYIGKKMSFCGSINLVIVPSYLDK